jgi:quinol monooxygenase YgiN
MLASFSSQHLESHLHDPGNPLYDSITKNHALEGLVEPTMGEPGVKLFLPYRSPTNPSQFFIYELYKNEEAWGTHQATEHFKKAINELLPRVSRRDRVPFVPYVIL